jgi:hypothetical protein
MKKLIFLLIFLPALAFSQKNDDKRIVITVDDSVGVYNKVKHALIANDFIIKDDGKNNTLTTYPREFKKMAGYAIVKADIQGDTIILYGFYGLKKMSDFGFTESPSGYKPIVYFKSSRGWRLLMQIADLIGQPVTYSK